MCDVKIYKSVNEVVFNDNKAFELLFNIEGENLVLIVKYGSGIKAPLSIYLDNGSIYNLYENILDFDGNMLAMGNIIKFDFNGDSYKLHLDKDVGRAKLSIKRKTYTPLNEDEIKLLNDYLLYEFGYTIEYSKESILSVAHSELSNGDPVDVYLDLKKRSLIAEVFTDNDYETSIKRQVIESYNDSEELLDILSRLSFEDLINWVDY